MDRHLLVDLGRKADSDQRRTARRRGVLARHRQLAGIAAQPLPAYWSAAAVLVGGRVVVIAQSAAQGPEMLVAAAYDLAADTWTGLPAPPVPAGLSVAHIAVAATADTVHLWSMYNRPDGGVVDGLGGVRVPAPTVSKHTLQMLPSPGSWSLAALPSAGHGGFSNPMWTGQEFLHPAAPTWIPHRHPRSRSRSGHRFDPATGIATAIAVGPVDDLMPRYLWTGAALIAFDTGSYHGGGGGGHIDYPGQGGAVWDPTTDSWTSISACDVASDGAVAVWTGEAILLWGRFLDPRITWQTPETEISGGGRQFTPRQPLP